MDCSSQLYSCLPPVSSKLFFFFSDHMGLPSTMSDHFFESNIHCFPCEFSRQISLFGVFLKIFFLDGVLLKQFI